MTYDEFAEKLRKIKQEYARDNGKELESIEELERVLDRRLMKPKIRGARSLRGILR